MFYAEDVKVKFPLIPVAVCLVLLSGCGSLSDPKAATEENFKAVLEPLVSKMACSALPLEDAEILQHRGSEAKPGEAYPLIGYMGFGYNFGTGKWVEGGLARDIGPIDTYRKLAELGALDRKVAPIEYTEEQLIGGLGMSQRPHKYEFYTPTGQQKEIFTTMASGGNYGQPSVDVPAVCFGTGKITSIQFTIPEDGQAKSSRVEYTWSAEPISDAARQIYDQDIPLFKKPPLSGQDAVILVLTNNGWQKMERSL